MPTRSVRIVALSTGTFSAALALVALLDRTSIERFPSTTRPFLAVAAIAYLAVALATWRLAATTEPALVLTRYRHALLILLGAYAVSFVPLAAAVLPLGAATLAASAQPARALARVLRGVVLASVLLSVAAFAVAGRAEDVFRQRLEGLVELTGIGLGSWHALVGVLAATQLPAVSGFAAAPSTATWQRFSAAYRRSWRIASVGSAVMVGLFVLTVALIQLERASGPPR